MLIGEGVRRSYGNAESAKPLKLLGQQSRIIGSLGNVAGKCRAAAVSGIDGPGWAELVRNETDLSTENPRVSAAQREIIGVPKPSRSHNALPRSALPYRIIRLHIHAQMPQTIPVMDARQLLTDIFGSHYRKPASSVLGISVPHLLQIMRGNYRFTASHMRTLEHWCENRERARARYMELALERARKEELDRSARVSSALSVLRSMLAEERRRRKEPLP